MTIRDRLWIDNAWGDAASGATFEVGENTIYYALAALKGVGPQAVELIVEARREGAFTSLADRCPTPGTSIPLTPRRGVLPSWAYQSLRHGQSLFTRYAHRSGIR